MEASKQEQGMLMKLNASFGVDNMTYFCNIKECFNLILLSRTSLGNKREKCNIDNILKLLINECISRYRSAILNAGYRVSYSHMYRNSIKTDAPSKVIWDIMRCYTKQRPLTKRQQIEGSPAKFILSKTPHKQYSLEDHPEANPESRKAGFLRFQENPLPYWGPGSRATAMYSFKHC